MKFLYFIFIRLLIIGFRLGSVFNSKIRKGWEGRKKSNIIVKNAFSPNDKVIWMHAASLGEYEQGLPVLEGLKKKYPDYKVLVTFFSPSGYENVIKKKTIADAICYLPFDTRKGVASFLKHFQVELFFTVKYDYWYNLLSELKQRQVKTFVVSALFYPSQVFFKPYGKWMVAELKKNINWFFHQTKDSLALAQRVGLSQSSLSGDTRYDRVKATKANFEEIPLVKKFKNQSLLLVFGSSWEAEEIIAEKVAEVNSDVKFIIAPHDLKRVSILKKKFPQALLYTELDEQELENNKENNILIINTIGLLSRIYAYADITVVGGGFHSAGLHNILESAVFGNPVLFGDKYRKNPEADALIEYGGGKSFSTPEEVVQFIQSLILDESLRKRMANSAEVFISNQPEATEHILSKF
ncbi:3-deoxy-D-manno-octulosonic acid transferase [Riemerella anatipestifer]|uniref:3-deoxy-D-manno-octulosonic acid transferase n=1 Tax=Riemerella anatipestifer TaxID=34085 RepID=A0A1S7DT07_RIEAN|nr:glycosyltransferase N-terminal domain-containing protein [Riemerella anatipestifer]AQY22191.1 3-deoxy-D-manno-octulosonic acid transferase [Riemerella anatipestifer]MCO4303857.1 3-deoxy-D-manno-octulosonic acid transferase [Riemerella anatipestifer]MCO7352722.1 3-deoxy-D-manno-octulosonic acid transferase [Riemerella anatipestifer]MCQ4039335.1 3-deoxy-D-manno-octulosonic acid transferase [Riemerella anatipestifer]MCT6760826.1 3-deoxy-D-manno-octulosonic acid transferase [Riemerella anatipes